MNTAEELRAVRAARHKQRKRLPLTECEQIILAYSPYGDAAGCTCRAKGGVDDGEQVRHNAGQEG